MKARSLVVLAALVGGVACTAVTSVLVPAAVPTRPLPLTYCGRISRLVQDHCQVCHHSGTAAPFSLMNYEDLIGHAENVGEAVRRGRMPPWFADPRYGKFDNDRRLKPEDIKALSSWLDGGMEYGDQQDLPAPRTYADGWTVHPDVVFELPEEQTIPASGTMPYLDFKTPTNFTEDTWLEAAELRCGSPSVIHHVNITYIAPDGRTGWVLEGVPGDWVWTLPAGEGRKIPKGSVLNWQMHYTPNGKPARDRSQLGLVFYKGRQPPTTIIQTLGPTNIYIRIPAHEPSHQVEVEWVAPQEIELLAFTPHMHLRGKDFEYKLINPDGKEAIVLSVPKYDFNWQTTYKLKTPLTLSKGTKIHCTAHFDNSAANPNNPDPTRTVVFGQQSSEEMMTGFFQFRNSANISGFEQPDAFQRVMVICPYPPPVPPAKGPSAFANQINYGQYWPVSLAAVPVLLLLVWLLRRR